MNDPLFEEYKAYYKVRAERYAGNPHYENSYRAEKNLSDLVQSCEDGQAFKERLGNMNELCAIALIRDESLMEKEHFEKHRESIRIQAAEEILQKADGCATVTDLITMVNEVNQKNSINISLDEVQRELINEWDMIDLAEIYAKAEVPDKYKSDMQNSAAEIRKSVKEAALRLTSDMQHWREGWKLQPEIVMEHRHRRLLPFTDEQIHEQIAKFKTIINV